jgi:predicted nuclease of predicted toxin-antitoxin system
MGISQTVARWLKSQGHDTVHLNDENLNELPDQNILEKAIEEKRIVLTTDMDFGHLLAFNKTERAQVVQFRTSVFTSAFIREKLELLLNSYENQLEGEFIITVEDNRIRFRQLPI